MSAPEILELRFCLTAAEVVGEDMVSGPDFEHGGDDTIYGGLVDLKSREMRINSYAARQAVLPDLMRRPLCGIKVTLE